ncbi:GNAT family N-acetyltransferase [Heyndrickxia sp. NPDC080065]|uniref:GNAT family N-acetyltransferase n=1 Tax=Heyndrickxia sp. NPDC080065 TaxID=3390568 RepID=UPI003CFF46A8
MLNSIQLDDIKKLQLVCEQEENIQLKLNWDMLETRNEKEVRDFFHYENDLLIGFLGLYGFGNKMELCGMVHPCYRRKGIFSKMFTEAISTIKKEKVKTILLNAPSNSFSAKKFLQSIPCHFSFSEHQMKWSEIDLGGEEDIIIRTSTPDDLETEIQLDVSCFDFSEEEAKVYNQRIKKENTQEFYLIEADQQKVGKIRVQHLNDEAWIYGFAIFPDYQGRGFGRKALKKIIRDEYQKGFPIFLEVETTNSNALRLYESCGFKTVVSQDYYEYK